MSTITAIKLCLLIPVVACSGSHDSSLVAASSQQPETKRDSESSLSGSWTGSWKSSSGPDGQCTLAVEQSGNQITGTVEFAGSPCASLLRVDASMKGSGMQGEATAGENRVTFSMTLFDARLGGTYRSVSLGACSGDTGTLELSRKSVSDGVRP
jgi:hypothetical protein